MSTRAQLFADAGQALYGDDWQQPLARLVGLNGRTVQRIAQAAREGRDYPVAPGVFAELAERLRLQAQTSLTVAAALDRAAAGAA